MLVADYSNLSAVLGGVTRSITGFFAPNFSYTFSTHRLGLLVSNFLTALYSTVSTTYCTVYSMESMEISLY